MKIPIIFSTDHNYIMQTGVTILSLIRSAKESIYDINIIINADVTEADKNLLKKQVSLFPEHSINFTEIGKAFEGCYEVRGISIASYSRLLIPWLFPQFDKIIYCDVDVIINTDLTTLYKEDLKNYLVAAVPSVAAHVVPSDREYILKLGLDPNNYCNAGILLINCKNQRDKNLKDQYLEEAQKEYQYQDQDIINTICRDRIKRISPKYNLTPYFYNLIDSDSRALAELFGSSSEINKYLEGKDCIIHYAGSKPWNTFTFAWNDWWQSYKGSIFYNPSFEFEVSKKILSPNYSWRKLASIIKHKLVCTIKR